jgi:hypothetical protein
MWNAPSDLDYYDQFNPEPPEEETEPEDPTPPPELEAQWEAADKAWEACVPVGCTTAKTCTPRELMLNSEVA